MQYSLITVFVSLLYSLINPISAQQQIFKNYTVNDGLISNSVRRIFQDSKGFLWIATWEGISKYDGNTFTNYNTANGLSHNMVNDFYESENRQLFVALNNGSIDVIEDSKINKKVITSTVINSFTHTVHKPVIATTDSAGLQELRGGKLIRPQQKIPSATYSDCIWLNDSVLIAVKDSSLEVFNNKFELLASAKEQYAKYTGSKIYQDSKQRIWISTFTGLFQLVISFKKNLLLSFKFPPAPFDIQALQQRKVNDIFEDADGVMWFGTTGGLIKINPNGTYHIFTIKEGLAANSITSIFQDKEKNIWFGTTIGLSKLVTKSGIQLYSIENGICTNDNLCLLYAVKKNSFLVSTYDDVKLFNKLTGNFTALANSNHQLFFNVVANATPPLLIGIYKTATIDSTTLQYKIIKPAYTASRIVKDKWGNFISGSTDQLVFYTGETYQKILNYRITALLIDKQGDLWAGTWQNGLFRLRYIITDNKFQILQQDHLLPEENIRSVFEDSKGNIWAGTRYKGVYRLAKNDKNNLDVTNYDQRKGLSSNSIKGIKEDLKGNFWIAFSQGLDKLIPQNDTFKIFNFSKINNYFTSIVGIEMDNDNSIWLATGEGLTHINDGELEKLPPLPVYITKVYSTDSVFPLSAKNIQLNYRQNQVQFEFASPGFINEKQVLYSYRLSESPNATWTEGSNQHNVSYASLRPGTYTFEVRTLGWNGNWGNPALFTFTIHPPFWQTWWFISTCLIILFFLIYSILKNRIKAIQHEAVMKQQIIETEMMALRAQMNPHFIFNCLNSIDNLIQMDEKDKATSYLSKFAKLIRSILENSKYNVVPCWKDIETLQLYLELEALRFDNKFSYTINMANEIMNGDYKVPPLIIQPFVENAIHHGLLNKIDRDKWLAIDISVTNNYILYSIEDNGVGRVKAASYKQLNKPSYESLGMQITSKRINIFNHYKNSAVKITDLYDEANNPVGTKVEVTLIIQP